jgi:hypothetical protein
VGERRHARYVLAPSQPASAAAASDEVTGEAERQTWLALAGGAELSRQDIERQTGLSYMRVLRALRTLMADGRVVATAPARSPLRRYRRSDTE